MDKTLKGKSINTSVSTIAVRFNANAEEIEEVYQSEDETSDKTNSEQTKTGDPESSPLKYLPRLGKRSSSTDTSSTTHDASPGSDPWKFFAGIKGKITKNIEDTITEIKQKKQEAETTPKKPKENLSDSEDLSESSISKTCGIMSTTEGADMSSEEDSRSFEDLKLAEERKLDNISQSSGGLRQRIRITRINKNDGEETQSVVSLQTLGKLIELNTGINPAVTSQIFKDTVEVESGVEALEDTFLEKEPSGYAQPDETDVLPKDLVDNVTENIDNLAIDEDDGIVLHPVSGADLRKTFVDDKESHTYFAPEGFVDLRSKNLYRRSWSSIFHSCRRFLVVMILLVLYVYVPIPVYFSGFIAGAVISVTLMTFYYTFIRPNVPVVGFCDKPITPYADMILTVPEIKEHIPITSFEGWMNEYPDEYNPLTYHISQTQSVYVKIQGNLLRISHSRNKIPKRAMWNEPKHKHIFTQHRIYNLLGAKITLLPEGLHKKRHWSKKYPICILLSPDQLNFDQLDTFSTTSRNDDSKDNVSTVDELLDKKESYTKKKRKKKIVVEPQIYSQLAKENTDIDFEIGCSENVSDLDYTELDQLGINLNENLLEDEDDASREVLIQEDDQVEEDVVSVGDWNSYIPVENSSETHLYLFGRTGREKEDWFRRLAMATHKGSDVFSKPSPDYPPADDRISDTLIQATYTEAAYLQYMSQFIKNSKKKNAPLKETEYVQAVNVLWVNAVLGRILYDWCHDVGFTNVLKEKIHKKLRTLKLPYFIEQLNVFELTLGEGSPLFHNVAKPVLDQRGLWVDLDLSYQGNIVLTLQTKLNLMKLKDPPAHSAGSNDHCLVHASAKWQNSDVEDTAESSTDDGSSVPCKILDDKGNPLETIGGTSTKSKKIMKVVDKITESKFFQAATENRYIKKAMEGVSNTDLSLKVEIKQLIGTLVLNIPPPPTDRLWIGFRPTPKMFLTAQPMVGVRNISFIKYLTNWIEKKLVQEFQKLLVIPNMEDFTIPNMSTDLPK